MATFGNMGDSRLKWIQVSVICQEKNIGFIWIWPLLLPLSCHALICMFIAFITESSNLVYVSV